MSRNKKILLSSIFTLGLLSIVPIVINSCSVNSTLNNDSTVEKPPIVNPPIAPKPSLQGDETNKDDFLPSNNGLYASIIEKLEVSSYKEREKVINDTIKSYSSANGEDVKNFINMWSFNKWFEAKNKLSSSMSSKITINSSNKIDDKWNISFSYKIELKTKDNKVIYAQKNYEFSDSILSSSIKFTTQTIEFKVNDKDEIGSLGKVGLLSQSKNVLENVKNFLNEKESIFDVYNITKNFLNNKNIKVEMGIWKQEIIQKGITLEKNDIDLVIDLNEIEGEWKGLKKGLSKSEVENILFYDINANLNGAYAMLNSSFVNLINDKKNLIRNVQSFVDEAHSTNSLKYRITGVKSDNYLPINLRLYVKNYKNS